MFLAMWWAWIFTAWATNWLNPQRAPVRLMSTIRHMYGCPFKNRLMSMSTLTRWS